MTRTVVRASSSSAFLALVPRLLECTPRDSLVLVPFTEGRSLGAMRVDLPGDASGDGDRVASTVIGMACKVADTDAIAVVVYTDEAVAATGLPHRALADAIIARADICGLRVVDALTVGPDGWDSYLDPSPTGPHALADITAHDPDPRVRPGNDQVSAAALPDAAPQAAAALARLLADVDALLGRARDRGKLPAERRSAADATMTLVSDPPALFEQAVALPADEIDPLQLAALAFCLERPALRDVALMQWAADASTGDAVLRAQTEYLSSRLFPADLASPMWGEGRRPDADRLRSALELCRRVAATVPRRRRPGALSACAWLAWAQGRSSHAGTYAEAALAIDSRHGLSTIMLGLLDAGHLPEWVFERPTSRGGRGSSRGSRGR